MEKTYQQPVKVKLAYKEYNKQNGEIPKVMIAYEFTSVVNGKPCAGNEVLYEATPNEFFYELERTILNTPNVERFLKEKVGKMLQNQYDDLKYPDVEEQTIERAKYYIDSFNFNRDAVEIVLNVANNE